MSERNRHPEWDVPAIAKVLIGAEHVTEVAPSDPTGATLPIGKVSLTLFPEEKALEFKRQTPEHTIFLRLSAAGDVIFSLTPTPPVETNHEPLPVPPVLSGVEREGALPTASSSSDMQAKPVQPPASSETEDKQRVVITGRVGRVPTIKKIKTGVMAKFPLAKHQPDGTTTWHTIVAFGKKAEVLRHSLARGEMISIAGYPHERVTSNPKTGAQRALPRYIWLASDSTRKLLLSYGLMDRAISSKPSWGNIVITSVYV
jgi:hypothetical protein